MTTRLALILCLSLFTCTACASADVSTSTRPSAVGRSPDPAIALIKRGFHGPVTIIKRFDGPLHLTGYVIELPQPQTPLKPPLYSVIYTDPTDAYVLAGVGIFDSRGENLTRLALEKYAPRADYSAAYAVVAHAAYFKEGRPGAPFIYAFFDANCIFCNRLWQETRHLVQNGELQIRWIAVGIIKRDSEDKAAGILESADPVTALTIDETAFDHTHEEGGFSPAQGKIPTAFVNEVRANDKIMREAGFYGTPVLLYMTKTGVKAQQGLPSAQELEQMRSAVASTESTDFEASRITKANADPKTR